MATKRSLNIGLKSKYNYTELHIAATVDMTVWRTVQTAINCHCVEKLG